MSGAEKGGDDLQAEEAWAKNATLYIFKPAGGGKGKKQQQPEKEKEKEKEGEKKSGGSSQRGAATQQQQLGKFRVVQSGVPLSKTLLNSGKIFMVDSFTECYLWVGAKGKMENVDDAEALVKLHWVGLLPSPSGHNNSNNISNGGATENHEGPKPRPAWAKLATFYEGGEPLLFREKFVDWAEPSAALTSSQIRVPEKVNIFFILFPNLSLSLSLSLSQQSVSYIRFNVRSMLSPTPEFKEKYGNLVEMNAPSICSMWRVQEYDRVQIMPSEMCHFYTGNCYILLCKDTLPDQSAR